MKNVLLLLFPYWSPVVPPAGLGRIKAYLEQRGHNCRIVDFNTKKESLTFYYNYIGVLRKYIPGGKRGTFSNLANDLMEQHLMAYVLRDKDEATYPKFVAEMIRFIYQVDIARSAIDELDAEVARYLHAIDVYLEYLVESIHPHLVGITLYKTTLPFSVHALKKVKAIDPTIKTVVGGGIFVDTLNTATPQFRRFVDLTTAFIDWLVIGKGEVALETMLAGEIPVDPRCIVHNDLPAERRGDEENWPIPDFKDFNTFKYSHLVATGSTGCPFTCTFCNELQFYGAYRKRDAERVHREMVESSRQNHGKRLFFMTDSLLNPGVDQLCAAMLAEPDERRFYMDTYFRVSDQATHVDRCLFWRKGGLYRVRLGIESGSQRMLDIMDKKSTLAQIRGSVRSLAAAGIKTTTYWIIGHPGETEADFQLSLDLLEELKDDIWQAECNPFRYYPNGNNRDDAWGPMSVPVYGSEFEQLYYYTPFRVEGAPSPEVINDRMNRFIRHGQKLGIPNPYSAYETFLADKRWQQLHRLSVPTIQEVNAQEGNHVDEAMRAIVCDPDKRTGTLLAGEHLERVP